MRDSIYIVARRVNVRIHFNRVAIASGRKFSMLLLHDMTIVTEDIYVFIDCTHIEIVTEHTS